VVIFETLEQESEKKENGIEKKRVYIFCAFQIRFWNLTQTPGFGSRPFPEFIL
jgi:hypothetical protein